MPSFIQKVEFPRERLEASFPYELLLYELLMKLHRVLNLIMVMFFFTQKASLLKSASANVKCKVRRSS